MAHTGDKATGPGGAGPPGPLTTREVLRRLGPVTVLAALSASLPAIGAFTLLAFMPAAAAWLRDSGEAGPWIYVLGFVALSGFAVLATWPQAALGGFAFGMGAGTGAAVAGCVGGAVIGYEIARLAGGDRVMGIIRERPKLAVVRDALISERGERGFWRTAGIVALVRLPPSSPFAVTNILMASLGVPRAAYLIGTAAGVLPRTAVSAWIGHTVGMAKDGGFAVPRWVWIVGLGAMIVALAVIARIAERALVKFSASPAGRTGS